MLSPEQINEIHRLHLVEKWPQRRSRIARHLHIGRHTLAVNHKGTFYPG